MSCNFRLVARLVHLDEKLQFTKQLILRFFFFFGGYFCYFVHANKNLLLFVSTDCIILMMVKI